MEKDREPDTYVKTILTFGDKPAPARAQTALRKMRGRKPEPSCSENIAEQQLHG